MLKKVMNKEFLQSVKASADYEFIINEVIKNYNLHRRDVITELTYSDRWLVYKKGDRAAGETPYFSRRHWLSSVAFLALLNPENEQYKKEVNDLLWAICGEYCWVVGAHGIGELEDDLRRIDLFNAETGLAVAEICHVLGDIIEPAVKSRVSYELNRRIIEPWVNYTDEHASVRGISNWSAVCSAGTAGVLYYERPDLFGKYVSRFADNMEYFKKSFADDGTCIEGPSYWLYGFGNFCVLAEMIRCFTNGEVDLFDEKAIKMAGYMSRSFLCGNTAISFSDSVPQARASVSIMHYLYSRFPNDVPVLPNELTKVNYPNIFWMSYVRALEYYNPAIRADSIETKDYYLPAAEQVILNRKGYSFAIKAGSNKEPHNQHDVGSFIFSNSSGQVLCDLGAPKYCMQYFDNNTRYDFLCASSRGHSVPIINGELQKDGPQYKGKISYENGVIKLEFGAAYGIKGLEGLERTVVPTENGVILKDKASGAVSSFVSRLVTLIKPEIKAGAVLLGDALVEYDAAVCEVSVSSDIHTSHVRMDAGTGEKTVYLIDFTDTTNTHSVELKISTK